MRSYTLPVIVTGILAVSTFFLKNYMSGGVYNGKEKMTGKTVVITGANTGIGKETVRDLAKRGARIVMACRDEGKCEAARQEIIKDTGNKNLVCQKLNLASFASIRAFAKEVLKSESRIDVLINNAGIMMCDHGLTDDGLELQLGTNHMGHFLLTNLLLEKLKASAPSRIINVSSRGHQRGTINFDDLNSVKYYSRFFAYAQSKLANLLHVLELTKRLEGTGVTANGLHPGAVDTELPRYIPYIGNSTFFHILVWPIKYVLLKDSVQGAQTTLRLAVDPSLEKVTGKYFSDCEEKEPYYLALVEADARKLWAISEEITNSKAI